MAAKPVMTLLHQGMPEGRIFRMGWDTVHGSGVRYYLIPDDVRDPRDLLLEEMRPFPAYDAMQFLSQATGLSLEVLMAAGDA